MRVLGMISGTSHDAIDACLVDFVADGTILRGTVVDHLVRPYPDELRRRLVAALPPAPVPMGEVCALDTLIGQQFARVAAELATRHTVDLVCSHGQTVFHWVEGSHALGTLQLGQPAWIAEATGVPVLSDVRATDIAAGGHGAPLVPILDTLLMGGRDVTVAALNLGGISNMTVLPVGCAPYAYDLGPANALIDAAVLRLTDGRESLDRDGRYAAQGQVDDDLLTALLADPYYALPHPKSTGKEHFHGSYLADHLAGHPRVSDLDVVTTLTELTARVVATGLERSGASEAITSGGGVANPTLMSRLADVAPGVLLRTTDELGAPSDVKEAIAFALIGYLSAHGLPGNVPTCTGASAPRVLGTLTAGCALTTGAAISMPERVILG